MEVGKMIFLSKWVIYRFHVYLPGVYDASIGLKISLYHIFLDVFFYGSSDGNGCNAHTPRLTGCLTLNNFKAGWNITKVPKLFWVLKFCHWKILFFMFFLFFVAEIPGGFQSEYVVFSPGIPGLLFVEKVWNWQSRMAKIPMDSSDFSRECHPMSIRHGVARDR